MNILEYICLDGDNKFRSKTIFSEKSIEDIENVITDAMLIDKSIVTNGDIVLVPVKCIKNPLKKDGKHWLIFCEYKYPNETNHQNNIRHKLEKLCDKEPGINLAITQEFVLFKDNEPLGWNKDINLIKNYSGHLDYSKFSQPIIDELTDAFLYSGIKISSFNMERMVGKWSIRFSEQPILEACDEIYLVRYLIHRICYNHGLTPSFISNPFNGCHIYTRCKFALSTEKMREEESIEEIVRACEKLQVKHLEQHKMLGKHNTRKFTYGQNNSKYDVNIVLLKNNSGYIEDRRCSGDCNVYEVLNKIVSAIVIEYSIQTMSYDLSELREKFNYKSIINFNSSKPVIYNNTDDNEISNDTSVNVEKAVNEKKKKKKEEKLAGLSGLARILKMNDDSDEEDGGTIKNTSTTTNNYDDINEGNRVKSIIDVLTSMSISHNILQSASAPKSKNTIKEPSQPIIEPTLPIQPINEMAMQPLNNNMMTSPIQQQAQFIPPHHQLGQRPPPNSLYTLPSQV